MKERQQEVHHARFFQVFVPGDFNAVFKLKPVFTVTVLHALAMPCSSILRKCMFFRTSQQEIGGQGCAHNWKTKKHELLCSAFRSFVASASHRS